MAVAQDKKERFFVEKFRWWELIALTFLMAIVVAALIGAAYQTVAGVTEPSVFLRTLLGVLAGLPLPLGLIMTKTKYRNSFLSSRATWVFVVYWALCYFTFKII